MYKAKVTDDFDNVTSISYTDTLNDYDSISSANMILSNCTDKENNFDTIIPTILFTIPFGLSFLCSITLLVYTLIKPLFNK